MRHTELFRYSAKIPFSSEVVYRYFESDGAFERLAPPWIDIRYRHVDPGIEAGNQISFDLKKGPFQFHWLAEITESDEIESFTDLQIEGPFSYWKHNHRFHHLDTKSSLIEDSIRYQFPAAPITTPLFRRSFRKELSSQYAYRSRILSWDIETIQKYPQQKLKIVIAGGSGFIGSALDCFLRVCGHEVVLLSRHPKKSNEVYWDPIKQEIEKEALENSNVIINLSGANIAKRWNEAYKKELYESRIRSTELLVETSRHLLHPPQLFFCASAVGYYGNRNEEVCTEHSSQGTGFLADICHEWEKAASTFPGRSMFMRFGNVISPRGGMLEKMVFPYKMGLGAVIGSGEQYMSWIAIDDLLYGIYHSLFDSNLEGPINFTSPLPVSQREFCKILANHYESKIRFHLSEDVTKLLFGQMGSELLLSSINALPSELIAKGFQFKTPSLEEAFTHLLGK